MCQTHIKVVGDTMAYPLHKNVVSRRGSALIEARVRQLAKRVAYTTLRCGKLRILPRRGSGFTIIEIIIVIVIMAIVAMMALPMISSAESFQIRAAANMVAADLEYAKSMAISRGRYYSVVFDTANESYEIQDQNGVIKHPIKKGDFLYEVDFDNDSRLSRVDIVSANFNGTSSEVKFDYLGSPYAGDDSPLNSGVITLQAGTIEKTVNVEPVTGYISISE